MIWQHSKTHSGSVEADKQKPCKDHWCVQRWNSCAGSANPEPHPLQSSAESAVRACLWVNPGALLEAQAMLQPVCHQHHARLISRQVHPRGTPRDWAIRGLNGPSWLVDAPATHCCPWQWSEWTKLLFQEEGAFFPCLSVLGASMLCQMQPGAKAVGTDSISLTVSIWHQQVFSVLLQESLQCA